MTDSPRWCERCKRYGDHHTDRCPEGLGLPGAPRPLRYRNRFVNWLYAKPWEWDMRAIYRTHRSGWAIKHRNVGLSTLQGESVTPPKGRLRSAWLALCFPHVHSPEEDAEATVFEFEVER